MARAQDILLRATRYDIVMQGFGGAGETIDTPDQVGPAVKRAFSAGVLHDLGKLILVSHDPQLFRQAITQAAAGQRSQCEVEQELFGTDHTEAGAWLAAIWGLPNSVVEAIALHHRPVKFLTEGFSALTAVHVANVLEGCRCLPQGLAAAPHKADADYLQGLGVSERWPEWIDCAAELAA